MSKIRFLRGRASSGCTTLSNKLKELGHDVKKVKITGSSYKGHPAHIIINWGSSSRNSVRSDIPVINRPSAVAVACSKSDTFRKLKEFGLSAHIPRWTTELEEAKSMIEQEREVIYCRTLTRGSQGAGIVVAETVDQLVRAPLYTAKVDVERELRVHVFRDSVIDFAQKKKMSSERRETEGIEVVNDDIRSHANGWVFARDGVQINDHIRSVSCQIVRVLGLDFGAVDLAVTPQGAVKVYEVNTAPGLEGTTLEKYALAIASLG